MHRILSGRSVAHWSQLLRPFNARVRRSPAVAAVLAALLLGSSLVACSGKERQFISRSDGGGPNQGTNELNPSAGGDSEAGSGGLTSSRAGESGSLGSSCSEDQECSSTFCVDGICCSSSCDQVCSACDTAENPGTCTVVGRDDECDGRCPLDTDCIAYGSGLSAANCDGIGQCRVITEGDCEPLLANAGTLCVSATGTCNDNGACVVPNKKVLGESCVADDECAEGHCVVGRSGNSLCCTAACDGPCQTCSDSGRCDQIPSHDASCEIVDCAEDNLCRDYGPDLTTNLCRGFAECRTVRDCSITFLRPEQECACEADGSCSLVVGAACDAADECRSGACDETVDGLSVCCADDCAAQGMRCSRDGSHCVECEGDTAECLVDQVTRSCIDEAYVSEPCGNGCDRGTGTCAALRDLGAACTGSAQCLSALCAPDVNATNRCCDPSCAASGRVCGVDGTCVCPTNEVVVNGECRRIDGETCESGAECASTFCVATPSGGNICCNSACDGDFCSLDGSRCVECEGSGGQCAGAVSQRCVNDQLVPETCGNGCNASTGFCNGLLGQGTSCDDNSQCGSGLCASDTEGNSRCCAANCAATGRVCGTDGSCICAGERDFVRNQCRARVGTSCSTANDCASGACVASEFNGNVCCSSACPGLQCRGNGQGCVECEGTGSECVGGNLARCQANFLQITSCGNGCSVQNGQAACNALRARGNTCAQSSQCDPRFECARDAAGTNRCCDPNCESTGRTCSATGVCQCPAGLSFAGNRCGLNEGGVCTQTSDCLGNLPCTPFYLDLDFDGFGGEELKVCGTLPPPPAIRQGEQGDVQVPYVATGGDCCDIFGDERSNTSISSSSSAVNPGQEVPSSRPARSCAIPFDFNCDGNVTPPTVTNFVSGGGCGPGCTGGVTSISSTCPGSISVVSCALNSAGTCVAVGNGGPISCL